METISPEKIVEILKEHGTHVTIEEAKIILEFMNNLASIAINVYVGK
ncbi:hypothetical protein [Pinibacter soli]|jgi:hypothetical protein|uniref:Uncharacterized protein n=1 Tax=Pinibacter soli TaxID=3044211 RepID=A0ABT6RFN1_9BACT|nr:hypothetical protein [Pinibacter soli]MDI3321355.1 hypothetical protein [Pinibacter soli]